MEYLINVAISFVPYAAFAIVTYVVVRLLVYAVSVGVSYSTLGDEDRTSVSESSKILMRVTTKVFIPQVLVLGLVVALLTPVNTYKHDPNNRAQRDTQIRAINEQRAAKPVVIQDLSRQPSMTPEERAAHVRDRADYSKGEQ